MFNAIKYTPDNGKIHITWKTVVEGACMSVGDTGIGVDPALSSRPVMGQRICPHLQDNHLQSWQAKHRF